MNIELIIISTILSISTYIATTKNNLTSPKPIPLCVIILIIIPEKRIIPTAIHLVYKMLKSIFLVNNSIINIITLV